MTSGRIVELVLLGGCVLVFFLKGGFGPFVPEIHLGMAPTLRIQVLVVLGTALTLFPWIGAALALRGEAAKSERWELAVVSSRVLGWFLITTPTLLFVGLNAVAAP